MWLICMYIFILLNGIHLATSENLVLNIGCQLILSVNIGSSCLINPQRLYSTSKIPESPAYGVYILQLIRYARACSSSDDFVSRGRLTHGKADDARLHKRQVKDLRNIPEAPAYGVYISQLIRYARACSSYDDFVSRGRSFTAKLMTQGYKKDKLKIYGVIANRYQGTTQKENVSLHSDCNNSITIRLHWQNIDSKESFQLLRSLHQLQNQNCSMDLIILSDSKNILCDLPGFLYQDDSTMSATRSVHGPFCYINSVHKLDLLATSPSYCSTTKTSCIPSEYNKEITFNPDFKKKYGLLSLKLISCIKSLKWTGLLIFYEDIAEDDISEVILALSFEGWIVLSYQVNENLGDVEITKILKTLDKTGTPLKNVTIVGRTLCISKILFMAGHYVASHPRTSSIRHRSQWLVFDLTGSVTRPWTKYVQMIDNIACVSLPLLTMNAHKTSQAVEFLIRRAVMTTSANKTLTSCRSRLLSEIVYQLQMHNGNYQKNPVDTLMWTKEGRSWSNVDYVDINGGFLDHGKIFPNLDFGFNGRQMNVSTLEWDPFVKYVNGQYEGLCFDLLNALSSRMNFTYHVENPPDKQWGTLDENGTWTGMIGQLARADVDLVVAPISVQQQREMVMDFTYSFLFGDTAILLQKPNPMKTKWRASMDPFTNELWICITLILPVLSLFLFLLEQFSPYYKDKSSTWDRSDLHTYQDSFWYMYGALLTQGGEHLPRSSTGRILLSSWWLFSIILMATYSGNLIAFMTVNKTSLPFTTIKEMLDQDKYSWGTVGGTIWETTFKQSILPEYQQIWQGIVKFNKTDRRVLSSSSSDHIRKVKEGNYAYIADRVQMEFKVSKDCSLKIADESLIPLQYSLGLPNHSPYTKLFSDEIIALHENGLLRHWKARRWPRKIECAEDQLTDAKAMSLIDVQSAFYVAIIGTVLGSVMLLAERVNDVFKRRFSEIDVLQKRNIIQTVPNEVERNNGITMQMQISSL